MYRRSQDVALWEVGDVPAPECLAVQRAHRRRWRRGRARRGGSSGARVRAPAGDGARLNRPRKGGHVVRAVGVHEKVSRAAGGRVEAVSGDLAE